ncbi:MAG TPA: FAD binding domain-containing protein [Casimicrobiaceae bacterium]|nr:FAD binding domain-containing protein [Casimicrobiaceae bacterium]
MTRAIRFVLNGEPVEVDDVAPQTTLLEYLREARRLTGTKEGCAEGDCGACTVVLAQRRGGALAWKPINACIRLLPSVDGKAVFTVESLKAHDGTLHPLQKALVECHASQCGFCTPGFAMSLFGLYKNARTPSTADIHDALSGNLCRCTGYRPIVDAAKRMYALPHAHGWRGPGLAADGTRVVSEEEERLAERLAMLAGDDALDCVRDGKRWTAPRTMDELARACAERPAARIVAGMTDIGLWVTKELRDLDDVIYVGDVEALTNVRETDDGVEIGAAVTLAEAMAVLDRLYPELHEAWQRFASVPIRNSATLVGNVANGSPIGDSMPMLLALDARVVLHGSDERCSAASKPALRPRGGERNGEAASVGGSYEREVPLDGFYPGYRKTARAPGEFVAAIRIPAASDRLLLRAYKISKRYDQDISAVFACFALDVEGNVVRAARIGCGGVAATPVRARKTERLLTGARWDDALAERAALTLRDEFAPIDDMRATADYRRHVLANLMRRFRLETSGAAPVTRVEALVPEIR